VRPQTMGEAILRNLPAKTGKTLDEWIEIVRRDGPPARRDRVAWLKSEHGLGHVTAEQIVGAAEPPSPVLSDAELIDAQYADRDGLRPILDRVVEVVTGLGPDVSVEARQTYVSFQRGRQFGIVQPTTRTRVDVGLRLPGVPTGSRLTASGSFGSGSVTHRIGLASAAEVDAELIGWIRAAYEARG
jgi:predicted transport protein